MNIRDDENNVVNIRGKVQNSLEVINGDLGEKIYHTIISAKRLSGKEDCIPVVFPEHLMTKEEFDVESEISIRGQFRSYNRNVSGRNQLKLYIYVNEICDKGGTDEKVNEIALAGFICKKPHYRVTPLGKEITDIMLAVDRSGGKNDYIPCICWWTNAKQTAELEVGDKITIRGRIQSREYIKRVNGQEETRTAYEVSAREVIPG